MYRIIHITELENHNRNMTDNDDTKTTGSLSGKGQNERRVRGAELRGQKGHWKGCSEVRLRGGDCSLSGEDAPRRARIQAGQSAEIPLTGAQRASNGRETG